MISPLSDVLFGAVGRRTLRTLLQVVDLTVFLTHSVRRWAGRRGLFNRASYQAVLNQTIFTGIDALPAVTLLAAAVGAGLVTELILLMQAVGTERDVANLLTRVVGLELAPLLTAIIVVGRTGSAIAVDLGNMKLHKEVEGLALLGIDVQDLFVGPRLVAVAVSQLVLAIYFAVLAVVSGVLFSALVLSSAYLKYLIAIPLALDPVSLVSFFAKNLLFGIIIASNACYYGLAVEDSPTQVPQATQKTIVVSLVAVFLLDGLLAVALA